MRSLDRIAPAFGENKKNDIIKYLIFHLKKKYISLNFIIDNDTGFYFSHAKHANEIRR